MYMALGVQCAGHPKTRVHGMRRAGALLGVVALLGLAYSLLINPLYGTYPRAWPLPEPDPWIDIYKTGHCTLSTPLREGVSPEWPSAIPPLLHFVVKSRSEQRRRHADNTASLFEKEVGGRVLLWDDHRCRAAVHCTAWRGYAGRFDRETWGPFKADLCRYAVLYLHGGLYVDDDLEFIQSPGAPLRPQDTLVAPREYGLLRGYNSGIFQAYLAAAPQHPAIKNVIRELNSAPAWVSTDWNRIMLLKQMETAPDARMFHESKLPPNHKLWRDTCNATGFCNLVISEDDGNPIRAHTHPYAFSHTPGSRIYPVTQSKNKTRQRKLLQSRDAI